VSNSAVIIDDGSGANQYILRAYLGSNQCFADGFIVASGTSQADFGEVNIGVGNTVTHSIAYKANDTAYARNGDNLQLDNTITLPSVNRMILGGSTPCCIERVAIYPARIANNELLSLTRN
jgi:hypothetical protein